MNTQDKQNDSLWKWGVFYYNPQDPEIVVEKRKGIGTTLNFAHKLAYLYVLLPLVIPAALLFFLSRYA